MASIIAKRQGKNTYYYVAVSKRVDGKPRIVQQTYLGRAERIAALVRDRTAPIPLEATSREFGLPAALWQAAQRSGAFEALLKLWPAPRQGPSTAHYLLLAAFHRICAPGPKTEVADWYRASILPRLWGFAPERFRSQAFWDCCERLAVGAAGGAAPDDALEQAQSQLLQAFRGRHLVGSRVLAYDTTNFHTWIATTNTRNTLAQRGRNKQKRHDLRQVGLAYALDAQHGLSLCHHVYPGAVPDSEELPAALGRLERMLERAGIAREEVTLVLDKGSAALDNTLELQQRGLGWVAALPWNQAPAGLRATDEEELKPVGGAHPGVRAAAQRCRVHGGESLCVVQHSTGFAAEQLHSTSLSLAKATQALRRLARELAKPRARCTEQGLRQRLARWLAPNFVSQLLSYELSGEEGRWRLEYELDNGALQRLIGERFGRTTLFTNRLDWSAAQVVEAYGGQQHVERVFRGLKGGEWLGWGPLQHWTDSKIQVHAFYCMLGISLLQYLHKQAETVWPGLSMEDLLHELRQMQQFELLYAGAGGKGKPRVETVMSKQTLVQQSLAQVLELDQVLAGTSG